MISALNSILIFASQGTEIVLTLLAVVGAVVLIFLLYKSIKRENKRFAALSDETLTMTVVEMKQVITHELNSNKADFVLLEVTLNDIENIEKVCGEEQFKHIVAEMLNRIKMCFSGGVRFANIDKERIWVYIKNRLKKEGLQVILRNMIAAVNKPIVLIGALQVEFDINVAAVVYEKGMGGLEAITANLELTTIASKKRGHNNAVIFDRSVSNISTQEYTLYTEIKQAIKNNDFRIFYQPIVNTHSLECFAVEAYLRWQHETKGIISPDVFMPSLEHSGDIIWVGMWALEEIAKQLEYWRMNNPEAKVKVNVNWSLNQLSVPSLHDDVRKILKKYKVTASDFFFEIQNFKSVLSVEAAMKNITVLRQIGIGIAIDNINLEVETIMELDSGTVSMLKFNRDFTNRLSGDNPAVQSIAEMIVKTSTANNILVVGEGVENDETLEKFQKIGIGYAQGYYFSKPKSPSEAMASIQMTPWKK